MSDTQVNPDEGNFNVYKQPCMKDAINARATIIEFKTAVQHLLLQFEDHPALLQLISILDRILSFPVNSPLMKFTHGLEMLLERAQLWESYAASHVSLRPHLEAVTQHVLSWRKMELSCWKNVLKCVEEKVKTSVGKWWFHFLSLVSALTTRTNDEELKTSKDALSSAVVMFIEQSSIGEFESRLQMINILQCHMKMMGCSKLTNVNDMLWNHIQYFSMYVSTVKQSVEKEKSSIEKELKDYVKIARWNDINFFAMKQAVDKSHRTISKYARRYTEALEKPVYTIINDEKSCNALVESVDTMSKFSTSPAEVGNSDVGFDADEFDSLKATMKEEDSILYNIKDYHSKALKHAHRILNDLF
jgi:midasin